MSTITRLLLVGVTFASLAACSGNSPSAPGPAGQPSSTDVNPITGSRGGTNGR